MIIKTVIFVAGTDCLRNNARAVYIPNRGILGHEENRTQTKHTAGCRNHCDRLRVKARNTRESRPWQTRLAQTQLLLLQLLKPLALLLIVPHRPQLLLRALPTRHCLLLRKHRLAAKRIAKAWNVCSRRQCLSKRHKSFYSNAALVAAFFIPCPTDVGIPSDRLTSSSTLSSRAGPDAPPSSQ